MLIASAATESVGSALGSVFASLGRPTNGIGLAAISSHVRGFCCAPTWFAASVELESIAMQHDSLDRPDCHDTVASHGVCRYMSSSLACDAIAIAVEALAIARFTRG